MSLDNFFDQMEQLNKRRLIHLPDSFVKTEKIVSVILPIEYKHMVLKYFPECDIIESAVEIVVVRDE